MQVLTPTGTIGIRGTHFATSHREITKVVLWENPDGTIGALVFYNDGGVVELTLPGQFLHAGSADEAPTIEGIFASQEEAYAALGLSSTVADMHFQIFGQSFSPEAGPLFGNAPHDIEGFAADTHNFGIGSVVGFIASSLNQLIGFGQANGGTGGLGTTDLPTGNGIGPPIYPPPDLGLVALPEPEITFGITVASETDEAGTQAAVISEETAADDTATFTIALGGDALAAGNTASVTVSVSGTATDGTDTTPTIFAAIQAVADATAGFRSTAAAVR